MKAMWGIMENQVETNEKFKDSKEIVVAPNFLFLTFQYTL